MKYYCIEYEVCGFADTTTDIERYEDRICPACGSFLLAYQDNEFPAWLEPVGVRPYGLLGGAWRLEDDDTDDS